MADVTIHEISEDTLRELHRRAQHNSRSIEAEVISIVEELFVREKYIKMTKEQGLGSALNAIGRAFDVKDEFEDLRDRPIAG